MHKSIIIIEPEWLNQVFCQYQIDEISELTDRVHPPVSRKEVAENPSLLNDVDVILGGWLLPVFDESLLNAAPNLKAIFYAAGTIKGFITPEFIKRDILVTSAQEPNAVPVAEFCLGAILLSSKQVWRNTRSIYESGKWSSDYEVQGNYDTTIGIISLGAVALRTVKLLKQFDLHIKVHCPFLSLDQALKLGVEKSTLDDIFIYSDVISLHTPNLPETQGMIKGAHFKQMKPGATFINTARGTVVNQKEMFAELKRRPEITALLDVLNPEPPLEGDELLKLPNVFITPHIAGSMGRECRRLGQTAIDELRRFVNGEELQHRVEMRTLHCTA